MNKKHAHVKSAATAARVSTFALLVAIANVIHVPFVMASPTRVAATIQPDQISLGEAARLTVDVQGQADEQPELPSVDGLSFQHVGQSSQVQFVNGAMSAEVSHTFLVLPHRAGTFTIPGVKIGGGRDAAESQPLTLTVLKSGVGAGAGANSHRSTQAKGTPTPASGAGRDEDAGAIDRNSIGFLRIILPKRESYVGELVPVELKAYFRAGVELRVDGLPRLNSDAFTMNRLGDQPDRSRQIIGGIAYSVFSWRTALTAVKAGDYEMSVEIPTTVTVRQRPQGRPRGGSPFGDSLFDDFFDDSFFNSFFGSATQKQIALSSRPEAATILPLPAEDRPESFSGAVGSFQFNAAVASTQATVGDPVTLRMKITGEGNFDRVNAPELAKSDAWKIYQPGSTFEPEDGAGISGTKSFEQALVPTQPGPLEVPALTFSFFDPQAKQYVTRTNAPFKIQVSGVAGVAVAARQIDDGSGSPSAANAAHSDLVPNKVAPGRFVATLRPWAMKPWLLGLLLLPVPSALGFAYIQRRRERLANDPVKARATTARRVVREQLDTMESAVSRGETHRFFAAARAALRQQLGLRWGVQPDSITLVEVEHRMNGAAEGFRHIFNLADEVTYTGRHFQAAELQGWLNVVRTELKKLEVA